MKKSSKKKEPLLNALAREVGRVAGTIASATQGLAINATAMVQTDKSRGEPTGKPRRRAPLEIKKKRTGKPAASRSRKRTSHRSER